MSRSTPSPKQFLRNLAVLLGVALLTYLITRAGTDKVFENAKEIGWGILLVLGLAGIGHVVKTWAWRLTLPGEIHKVSFSRTLALRLVSEAIGQFGFVGQVIGDATRGSLLSSELSASGIVSSVTLDRGLFMVSGLLVTVAGIIAVLFLPAVHGRLRTAAGLFGVVLLVLFALSVQAVRRGWPVLSGTARTASRIPWFKGWLQSKESVILAAEEQLLNFHSEAPVAFWSSTILNFVAHGLAIGEVYLILLLMGCKVGFVGALTLEALTKLINAIGAVNPGNVGTYEGGNMAIVKLVGLTPADGLTLGLCRRFRSIVWAIVGGICLVYLSRSKRTFQRSEDLGNTTEPRMSEPKEPENLQQPSFSKVAVIMANQPSTYSDLQDSALAEVGALPLALRAILGARSAGVDRIVVAVDPVNGPYIRRTLERTKRLPTSVEWVEVPASCAALAAVLGGIATDSSSVMLIRGACSYHPSLYRKLGEWDGPVGGFELTSGDEPVGMIVLSRDAAIDIALCSELQVCSFDDLHAWIRTHHVGIVEEETVANDLWQTVASEPERLAAEAKLDRWLVKPTDGVFARMNRGISIPISRQLIKFPITANMVSIFTLGVSFTAGLYYAFGGYWNVLIGALLSLGSSILDGCDGEVARLKLQASDFGCWLETVCDYLYYLFIFAGMAIGLARSWHARRFLVWGAALFAGAILTFIIAARGRRRLSGDRPDQYLSVWHKKAESRLSNPLIYIGRYAEFVVRRCFLPYALLVLAIFNFTPAALYASALGANIAWIIALYSHVSFTVRQRSSNVDVTRQTSVTEPVTV